MKLRDRRAQVGAPAGRTGTLKCDLCHRHTVMTWRLPDGRIACDTCWWRQHRARRE